MKKILIVTFNLIVTKSNSQKPKIDLSDLLVNTTIKIISQEEQKVGTSKKSFYSAGTGFFFNFRINDTITVPAIVTNRHVVRNSKDGYLVFSLADTGNFRIYGKVQQVTVKDLKSKCIYHPDTTVDLAIIPINPILEDYRKKGIDLLYVPFEEALIPNDSIKRTLTSIENIYMIGYPFGTKDEYNNLPIIRRGITATPLNLNYDGRKEFLADIPVYFGSSGSPIILYESGKYGLMQSSPKVLLLGINYATYLKNYEGKLLPKLSFDSLNDSLKAEVSIPYNLGLIIKSERLLEFKPIIRKLVGLK